MSSQLMAVVGGGDQTDDASMCKVKNIVKAASSPEQLVPATACSSLGVCSSALSPSCKQCKADVARIQAQWATNRTIISSCSSGSVPQWMSYYGTRTVSSVDQDAHAALVSVLRSSLKVGIHASSTGAVHSAVLKGRGPHQCEIGICTAGEFDVQDHCSCAQQGLECFYSQQH